MDKTRIRITCALTTYIMWSNSAWPSFVNDLVGQVCALLPGVLALLDLAAPAVLGRYFGRITGAAIVICSFMLMGFGEEQQAMIVVYVGAVIFYVAATIIVWETTDDGTWEGMMKARANHRTMTVILAVAAGAATIWLDLFASVSMTIAIALLWWLFGLLTFLQIAWSQVVIAALMILSGWGILQDARAGWGPLIMGNGLLGWGIYTLINFVRERRGPREEITIDIPEDPAE